MYRLRVYLFAFLAWLSMLGFGLWAILIFPLPRQRWRRLAIKPWTRLVLWLAQKILFISYRLEGREHLPKDRPFILACQHQSMFETLVMEELFDNPGYVMKKELLHIPLFGWFIRRLPIATVERSKGGAALKRLASDAQKIQNMNACPLVIFPQGTRQRPIEPIKLHIGFALLCQTLNWPLVPMVLNTGRYWPKEARNFRPGTLVLKVLPPIEPEPGAQVDPRTLKRQLQTLMEAEQEIL